MHIIDPPSPFDPASDWEAHLARLEKLAERFPDDATISEAITVAEAHLASIA